ncbi:MAG: monomeric [FeFe] hydrogenase [Spirochaetales bacterium]|nr:monomeric [FeFe] hydrogenase [Spirochaetales bacterium]
MLTLNNQSNYIRKELMIKLLKSFFEGKLEQEIDRIPIDMNPKDSSTYRCCIYKDRAMIRYRIMALLGVSIEKEDNEYKPLKEYLNEALDRKNIDRPVMTVLDTACSSCRKVAYTITDACRGCLARPCSTNCPFGAISFINGHAQIDSDLCRNCGKCKDLCPFNAIIHTPVPCEESCPVGAVSRDDHGRMCIDYEKCISCGRCGRSCPFGAVMERSQIIDVASHIKNGTQLTAILAPSVIGQFPGSLKQTIAAVKAAGFNVLLDVADGAETTAKLEAEEFTEQQAEGKLLATSCCPAWVEAAEKHIDKMRDFVSSTKTPMYYTAETAKKLYPYNKIVFIGPCTAKKNEALRDSSVDYVLNFEELGAFFIARGIDVNDCSEKEFDNNTAGFQARAFAAAGGVAAAVESNLDAEVRKVFKPFGVDGLSRKNINLLKTAAAGKLPYNMIEVMSCEGGCICGPGVISNPKIVKKKLDKYKEETA